MNKLKNLIQELKNNKKLYISLFVAELIIIAGLLVFLLKRPISNVIIPILDGSPKTGTMYEQGYDFNESDAVDLEEDEKVFFNLAVPVDKGSYYFRVKYRASKPNYISLYSKENNKAVYCDNLALTHVPMEIQGTYNFDYGFDFVPGYSYSNVYFTKDVSDVDVYFRYSGYGTAFIESVELIGNRNYILPILATLIFILILADLVFILYRSSIDKKILSNTLIIVSMGLVVSIPVLFKEGNLLHDLDFLLYRIEGISEGIRDGQIPVRIHPITLNGYGYAVSQFYPELFLYPFAFMRLLGYSIKSVLGAMIIAVNTATAGVTFYSINKVYRNELVAFIGAFLYTFSGYRLTDVYIRGSVGEYIAIIFLPLIIAGIYEIVVNNGSHGTLTVGLFGLLNSHLLSCEMVGLFAIIFAIICYKKVFSKSIFIKFVKSVFISILLSAYFIIPFIYISKSDNFMVYEQNAYETSESMLSVSKLFLGDYAISVIILLFGFWGFIISLKKYKDNKEKLRFVIICFALGIIAMIMTTSIFPWKSIENAGGLFANIFCMVQFPWRYISIATVLLLFAGCEAIEYCVKNISNANRYNAVLIIAITYAFVSTLLGFVSLRNESTDKYTYYDYGGIAAMSGISSGEYVPVGFSEENIDRTIEELNQIINNGIDTGLSIESYAKSGTKSTTVVANTSGEDRILYLPQVFYRGYEVNNALEDASGLTPSLFKTDYGTVGAIIPAGYYNGVHIEYVEPFVYRVAEIVSIVTLVLIILMEVMGLSFLKTKHDEI